MNLESFIRPDLIGMKAYSSARSEFMGTAKVFLDANENPNENGVNRYPDPLQKALKARIAALKHVQEAQIFLGNGSDECIDLLFRLFCTPGQDVVAAMSPSYGMYSVSARINNCPLREILLNADFSFPTERIITEAQGAKLLFLCSPNNPTALSIPRAEIQRVLEAFQGIVVLDEAYIDFAQEPSMLDVLEKYPNLVICQTLSKAYGLAGIRLGMLFADPQMVAWLNKIKPPYNINTLTQEFALKYLADTHAIQQQQQEVLTQRALLADALAKQPYVRQVIPSDANFILARVDDAQALYDYLTARGIVVRNRSTQPLCENTLRFTIGTPAENAQLISTLNAYRP